MIAYEIWFLHAKGMQTEKGTSWSHVGLIKIHLAMSHGYQQSEVRYGHMDMMRRTT